MREIKFRGKTLKDNNWVYGDLIQCENRCYIQPPNSKGYVDGTFSMVMIEVEPKTVGQFIDSCDTNRKEIYEGDIIRGIYEKESHIFTVKYLRSYFGFVEQDEKISFFEWDLENKEIIGNIYENSELLK